MPSTKDNAGMDTDNHARFTVKINGIERKTVEKLKNYYGFDTDKALFRALIKRAQMNMK